MPKIKTNKSAAKRFIVKKRRLRAAKRGMSGGNHNFTGKKSLRVRRQRTLTKCIKSLAVKKQIKRLLHLKSH